jgi:ribosomal protein S18 acetylase RimI-like enzyme
VLLTYKNYTRSDFGYVFNLIRKEIAPYVPRVIYKEEVAKKMRKNHTLIIYDENESVGVLSYQLQHNCLYIDTVALESSKQGQGIGRKIFLFLEKEAKVNNRPYLSLEVHKTNSKAITAYLKYGFAVKGKNQTQYIMRKKISL